MNDCSFYTARFEYSVKLLQCCLVVTLLVPRETAVVSGKILCTQPYNRTPVYTQCHFIGSRIRRVHLCLAYSHLHFWQNDLDLLRATAVPRGTDTEIIVKYSPAAPPGIGSLDLLITCQLSPHPYICIINRPAGLAALLG